MQETKKKILIVTTSLTHGGAEKASATQSKIFDALGYDVFIVTILSGVSYEYSGTLINLGKLKDKDDSVFGRIKRLNVFRKLLRFHKFNFIVDNRARNQTYREFIVSKLIYNAPVIYMIHSYDEKVAFTSNNRLNKFLYRSEKMIAVSHNVNEKFKNKYGLKSIDTISNGLDFETIRKKSKEVCAIEDLGDYILYYGRIHDYSKNLKLLIEAYSLSTLKEENVKLIIVGDGPDEAMLKVLVEKLGLGKDAIFKGFMDNPFPLVKEAIFTILTSRMEGFALTLVESLYLETPVISVNCESGPKEIVQHEINGLLVENYNAKKLSEEMKRLFVDSKLYNICKSNARNASQKFELKNVMEEWSELFKKMSS